MTVSPITVRCDNKNCGYFAIPSHLWPRLVGDYVVEVPVLHCAGCMARLTPIEGVGP